MCWYGRKPISILPHPPSLVPTKYATAAGRTACRVRLIQLFRPDANFIYSNVIIFIDSQLIILKRLKSYQDFGTFHILIGTKMQCFLRCRDIIDILHFYILGREHLETDFTLETTRVLFKARRYFWKLYKKKKQTALTDLLKWENITGGDRFSADFSNFVGKIWIFFSSFY